MDKPVSWRRRVAGAVTVALALAVAPTGGAQAANTVPAPQPAPPPTTTPPPAPAPLRILLTNDDGFNAPGIRAVRDALVAAGHDVTIVAPATDQSGSSGKVTFAFGATIQLVQQEPKVYSVGGTPADSVLLGLAVVFADAQPDLVVSGTNIGQNSGGLVGHSGTVGAAVTAIEEGVPAIAVSTELDLAAGTGTTLDRFDETARFVATLVDKLQRTTSGPVLPTGRGLNVNYPIVTAGDLIPDAVAFTQVGKWSFVEATYAPAGQDTFRILPSFPPFDEPVPFADTTALTQDKISISVLDGNLGANLVTALPTVARLFGLPPS